MKHQHHMSSIIVLTTTITVLHQLGKNYCASYDHMLMLMVQYLYYHLKTESWIPLYPLAAGGAARRALIVCCLSDFNCLLFVRFLFINYMRDKCNNQPLSDGCVLWNEFGMQNNN